jgi:hypothetical protein
MVEDWKITSINNAVNKIRFFLITIHLSTSFNLETFCKYVCFAVMYKFLD